MTLLTGDSDTFTPPTVDLSRFTALAVGPGLGGGKALKGTTRDWLENLWVVDPRPMVFDADALVAAGTAGAGPRVVTPHPGEAGRLLGRTTQQVQADRFGSAIALASGRTALLKGRHTLIATAGQPVSINPRGAPTLATAGSGDVLTGLIGALLARGLSAHDAARLGAWAHGRAGERLAAERAGGWSASDVAAAIPAALAELSAG